MDVSTAAEAVPGPLGFPGGRGCAAMVGADGETGADAAADADADADAEGDAEADAEGEEASAGVTTVEPGWALEADVELAEGALVTAAADDSSACPGARPFTPPNTTTPTAASTKPAITPT